MKFDITKLHSIFEAKDELTNTQEVPAKGATNDETGANIDNTLGQADLMKVYDDICPITGDIYAAMKNAASDPANVKVTAVASGNGEDAKMFVEATEFALFVEASGLALDEAADAIMAANGGSCPELDNAEFHVVFPSDCVDGKTLGVENDGKAICQDWAMKLMRGCRRYGLKVNAGVQVEPADESAKITVPNAKECAR